MDTTHPAQRRDPPELKERAVRMVPKTIAAEGKGFGVITRMARQLGIGSESLRNWVRQAEADRGARSGTTTSEPSASASSSARTASCAGPARS